jgi:putative Holliday junction resolvase
METFSRMKRQLDSEPAEMNSDNRKAILGVDFGLRRIGMAICPVNSRMAVGAGWIEATNRRDLVRAISAAARDREASDIVIGKPSANGRDADSVATGANELAEALSRQGFKIHRWDEDFTTSTVLTDIKEHGGRKKTPKGVVDEAAAVLILQGYLDAISSTDEDEPKFGTC